MSILGKASWNGVGGGVVFRWMGLSNVVSKVICILCCVCMCWLYGCNLVEMDLLHSHPEISTSEQIFFIFFASYDDVNNPVIP
jgi:hypothetical protein